VSFWPAYVWAEIIRRRQRTILSLLAYGLGISLAVSLLAVANSVQSAQASALGPLRAIDRDLYVSRAAPAARPNEQESADAQAFAAERQASIAAAVTDLAKLGPPGQHFAQDFFLPETAFTFSQDDLARAARVPGVESAAGGLTLVANHREGTIPEIVAEYTVQAQTIALAPPGPDDQAIVDQCVRRFIQEQAAASAPPPAKVSGSHGAGQPIPFTRAYYACLPPRLRQVQLEQQLIQDVIRPPQTDINTTAFSVAGIDPSSPSLGLITKSAIVQGSYFSPHASGEAVVAEAYAERKGLAVGASLTLAGSTYRVVGLSRPALRGLTSDVYVPLAELQRLSGREGRINVMAVRAVSNADVRRVTGGLARSIPGARVASAEDTAGQVSGSLADVAGVVRSVAPVALIAILLATFLAAGQVAFAGVGRRAAELGVLRTLGWRRRDVVAQVVAELLALGAAGGLLGVGVAAAVLMAIRRLLPQLQVVVLPGSLGEHVLRPLSQGSVALSPYIDGRIAALALLSGIVGGLIASAAASLRAVSVAPSETFRRVH
jgi:ABC-type antimicrobial peptide transport system permease subunit